MPPFHSGGRYADPISGCETVIWQLHGGAARPEMMAELKNKYFVYLSLVLFLTFFLTLFNVLFSFGYIIFGYFSMSVRSPFTVLLIDCNYLLLLSLLLVLYRRWKAEIMRRISNEEVLLSLQKAVETMQIGVTITDREKKILYCNPAEAEMHGYRVEDLIGRDARILGPRELWKPRLQPLIGRFRRETMNMRKDGSVFPVQLMSDVVATPAGDVFAVVTTCEDITERRKLEEQLRQSQKLEATGLLAGGIAHDFSNILTTIKGSMFLMQKSLPEDSRLMQYAQQVVASINKATNLSQGLLAFSRKQTIALQPLNVNETIRKVTKLLSQLIGEHIVLTMILSDRNPTVMADANQLEQVLMNLVANARDAMPDGGRLIIRTGSFQIDDAFKKAHGYGVPGEYYLISVSDTGTGIADSVREKIFEPFFTTKEVGKGSGLGLAVTYGIVKQHNGFVDVESVPGKGATFNIYIPIVEMEAGQPGHEADLRTEGGVETILLTEDDADTRTTMSEMLRMSGYKVREARDGVDAVELFLEYRDEIDLVLLDVRMPRKDGRQAYEEIEAVRPGTKFLFMSGYTADIIDGHGISEKGYNFISKASVPEEILRKIREVLDG
jgi:PAS domain S-box-containing protein